VPAEPLYTEIEAARALDRLQPVGYDRPVPVIPGVSDVEVEFINAGHLLGSAYARVRIGDKSVLFGGDLGRYGRPVLPDPKAVTDTDILLVESTYGDRIHERDDDGERLARIVTEVAGRGGRLIIPSFAIGRVEEVLYWLKRLEDQHRIPALPVYLDSPMALGALQFYTSRITELDEELHPASRAVTAFYTSRMVTITSVQQSKELLASREPAIVIAASGMATGGRVLYHLEAALPDPRNTVLFVGFQAAGTRGRVLCDGAKQVKIHGQFVPVAARIEKIDSMSAHADAGEIMRWLSGFVRPPSMTYLVHGEAGPLQALADRIASERQWPVHIAKYMERVGLNLS
jgi:metallo-beta-lactamase family protein